MKKHLIFWGFCFIYLLLGIINLDTLPVAWTDEIQGLDPAIQHLKTGVFKSIVWPNPSANEYFASYPPLWQWIHRINLFILPVDIFYLRLPFLLMHVGTIILTYFTIIKFKKNQITALLIVLLFSFDKAVFEISRSMRVDVPILLLISSYAYCFQIPKQKKLRIIILSILPFAHLYTWPFVLIFLWYEIRNTQLKNIGIYFCLPLILLSVFYLKTVNFQTTYIWEQLSMQANVHTITSTSKPHNPILNSLWYRFFPYYEEQFLMYGIYAFLIIGIPYILYKNITSFLRNPWIRTYLITAVLLFIIASPQYRYLPFFLLLGIFTVISIPQFNVAAKVLKVILIVIIVNSSLSFLGRHSAAIIQYNERDPIPVYDFLSKYTKDSSNKKSLIIGSAIGAYYTYRGRTNLEYGIDFYPENWTKLADSVFWFTHKTAPFARKIATYKVPSNSIIPDWAMRFAKGKTYKGLTLYKVSHSDAQKIKDIPID